MIYRIQATAGDVVCISEARAPFDLHGTGRNIADGISFLDDFADYCDVGTVHSALNSGYGGFEWKNNELTVFVDYETNRRLTDQEIFDLIEYTQGQWSDGIGEGFEQEPFDEDAYGEYFVSAWYPNQIATWSIEDESEHSDPKETVEYKEKQAEIDERWNTLMELLNKANDLLDKLNNK